MSIQISSLFPFGFPETVPELSYRGHLMLTHMVHVIVQAMITIPETVQTISGTGNIIDFATGQGNLVNTNSVLRKLLFKQLAEVENQESNSRSPSDRELRNSRSLSDRELRNLDLRKSSIAIRQVIELYTEYDRNNHHDVEVRLCTSAIVRCIMRYIVHKMSGESQISLDGLCTLLKEDDELNNFFRNMVGKPWIKELKKFGMW